MYAMEHEPQPWFVCIYAEDQHGNKGIKTWHKLQNLTHKQRTCREVKDVKMRTYAMDLVATQAILAFCKPTTASPFTAELVAEGGIVTLNKLLAFISSAPQVPELR